MSQMGVDTNSCGKSPNRRGKSFPALVGQEREERDEYQQRKELGAALWCLGTSAYPATHQDPFHITCFKLRVGLELPVLIVIIGILLVELTRPCRIPKLLKWRNTLESDIAGKGQLYRT